MTLNYKTLGAGPPVIILHGLFGMLDNWMTFAKQMAGEFTVYIVDQRNHGKSFHSDEFNYDILADDLDTFIYNHGLYNVSIIGHSMGGKTAMQFAINHPDQLNKLIVVDIGPKINDSRHLEIFDSILALDLGNFLIRKDVDEALTPSIPDMAIRQFLLKNLGRNGHGNFKWKANFKSLFANYPYILDNIKHDEQVVDIPVLFVRGTQSPYLTVNDLDHIRDIFPIAQMSHIDAGHWIHAEKPAELLQTIKRFLHYSSPEFVT